MTWPQKNQQSSKYYILAYYIYSSRELCRVIYIHAYVIFLNRKKIIASRQIILFFSLGFFGISLCTIGNRSWNQLPWSSWICSIWCWSKWNCNIGGMGNRTRLGNLRSFWISNQSQIMLDIFHCLFALICGSYSIWFLL